MTIPDIKAQLTITQVLDHYNYRPTAKGALQCPFHETNDSSKKKTFQIYTDTNRYQCFHKDCTAGNGDVIDFIEKQEHCTKHQAIEKAKQLAGYTGNGITESKEIKDASRSKSGNNKEIKEAHSDSLPRNIGVSPRGDGDVGSGQTGDFANKNGNPGAGLPANRNEGVFKVISPEQIIYLDEALDITVLGGIRLEGLDRMRVTLKLISVAQAHLPGIRHTLDMYNDDQLQKLVRKTAERLELGTSLISAALNKLTDQLEAYRLHEIEASADNQNKVEPLTEAERKRAIDFLKEPGLMKNTNQLLGKAAL